MRGYADLADKLVGTPRFLLDGDSCRTCVELNLARPKVTLEAMAHLVIPYPRLWVEWEDGDRQRLREHFPWEELNFKELRCGAGKASTAFYRSDSLSADNHRRVRRSCDKRLVGQPLASDAVQPL